MPRLGAYRDNDELDNAIADKVIVYVEGPDDVAFFRNLAGPDIQDRLEFKTPEEGAGYHQVKTRVAELRPSNRKVHGLLDGEAAVSLGHVDAFLHGESEFFEVDHEELDGVLFLTEYELENLLLCHARLARFITHNVTVAELGIRKEEEVQEVIDGLAPRFYLFSLIKFTMIAFHSEERPCKGIGKIGGKFLDQRASSATILRKEVEPQIAPQVDWAEFLAELRSLANALRARYDAQGLDKVGKLREAFRIADGKLMLKHVKNRYNGDGKWDGHLHNELVQSDYSARFREALLAATNPDHHAA